MQRGMSALCQKRTHASQQNGLFDDLVRASEQWFGDREMERGCKYAFPLLRKMAARLSTYLQCWGSSAGPNLLAYSASKGGVSLLTKSVALHGARYQPPVRCNAVCPAFIEGPMVDEVVRGSETPEW